MTRLNDMDISALPEAEDQHLEYKSSQVSFDKLKSKLAVAASGFWNAGGGLFLVGVSETGKPDGGLDTRVGRQSIRDWADQAIREVSPPGRYSIKTIEHDPQSQINVAPNKCILAIEFLGTV